mgnify:CR=1 FL=1
MAQEISRLLESIIPLLVLAVSLAVVVWIFQSMNIEPLLGAIIALEMFGLVLTERYLEGKGILKSEDKPLYYFGALAFVLLTWGLVRVGIIPLPSATGAIPMSKFTALAVFTATFWGFLVFIIVTLILGIIYTKRRAKYKVPATARY